jgi:hypothetical protein
VFGGSGRPLIQVSLFLIFVVLGLAFAAAPAREAFSFLNPKPGANSAGDSSYQGPCDKISGGCAEAWSVDRAMRVNYSGPLFQLALVSNPSTTLDIRQTSSHAADMSTWSAFCGGAQANCFVSKIYAQVHGHSNDEEPVSCNTLFEINATTGLPQAFPVAALGGNCPFAIGGAADNASVGVIGGRGSSVTVLLVGQNVQAPGQCCGTFLISHIHSGRVTPGTDFGLGLDYGNGGSFGRCSSSRIFCLVADLEIDTISGGNLGTSPINVVAMVSWNRPSNLVSGVVNNHAMWTPQAPHVSLDPGRRVHLGGGGDLSGPAPVIFYDGLITNTAISGTDYSAVLANAEAFYAGLTFP